MSSQVNGVTPVNQIRLTNVAYVRLKKGNQSYEVAAYRNKVVNWRNKIETDLSEVLQVQDVFTNVARGLVASKNDLLRGFDSTDKEAICKEILDKGEFQVSELERRALLESMTRDVAGIVVEKSYNTDTGRAYSLSMIQNAMKDIHFSVNLSKGAKQQALEVVRRLKKVMPIARSKLALRISTPSEHAEELLAMLLANAAEIVKRGAPSSSSPGDAGGCAPSSGSMTVIETNISPENFRVIEDLTTTLTQGKGILEIIHQQQALAPGGAKDEDDDEDDDEGEDKDGDMERVRLTLQQADEEQGGGGKQGGKGKMRCTEGGEEGGRDKDEEEEVVFFMAKSGDTKKKKKDRKKQQRAEDERWLQEQDAEQQGDKQQQKNPEGEEDGCVDVDDEEEASAAKSGGKKGKKNKRLQKERQKHLDSQEQQRAERLLALEVERQESAASAGLPPPPPPSSSSFFPCYTREQLSAAPFKCVTCSAPFSDSLAHRAHFKSDWHRINLKRKLRKLPLVGSEEEFYSAHIDHWDCDIDG